MERIKLQDVESDSEEDPEQPSTALRGMRCVQCARLIRSKFFLECTKGCLDK